MKHPILLTVALLLVLSACQQKDEKKGPLIFFDLAGYLDREAARIGEQSDVIKTITMNGVTETKRMEQYAWTSEFSLLRQWDINRPAWRDQYQRDTLLTGDQVLYRYQCLDDDLQVRLMEIWTRAGQTDSLRLTTRVDNPLRTTEGVYRYSPTTGLHMAQVSSKRFGSDQDLEVTVRPVGSGD
ncbi:MAG: hypothetical protein H6568_13550 [Lewinellaceae bacterium]|nr:hypothetical protein [Saprospiraceae bacterium]MCB9313780.1 hypothetical protein [Lewinellaceae bacterium]HRW74319.1 hypothetical protein [Saprospiraceae bacterium]